MNRFRAAAMLLASALIIASCSGGPKDTGIKGRAVIGSEPAPGAAVKVYDVPERSSIPPVASADTDEEGNFSVALPAGTYYVAVRLDRSDGPPYLSKVPPDPVVVADGIAWAGELSLGIQGGEQAAHGTGVKGRVVKDGTPVIGAIVYLYENTDTGLKGPSHKAHARTGADGRFELDAPSGSYYVAVRKRFDASASGELSPGDTGGVYSHNPVRVTDGSYSDTGDIRVSEIDAAKLAEVKTDVTDKARTACIRGLVTGEDGRPLAGIHVFAYDDYRMMGRPAFKSSMTGNDGLYSINVDRPGTYYIGARDSVGGPMEPGDMVGVYEGSKDNSVVVGPGSDIKGIDVKLKEVM